MIVDIEEGTARTRCILGVILGVIANVDLDVLKVVSLITRILIHPCVVSFKVFNKQDGVLKVRLLQVNCDSQLIAIGSNLVLGRCIARFVVSFTTIVVYSRTAPTVSI